MTHESAELMLATERVRVGFECTTKVKIKGLGVRNCAAKSSRMIGSSINCSLDAPRGPKEFYSEREITRLLI